MSNSVPDGPQIMFCLLENMREQPWTKRVVPWFQVIANNGWEHASICSFAIRTRDCAGVMHDELRVMQLKSPELEVLSNLSNF